MRHSGGNADEGTGDQLDALLCRAEENCALQALDRNRALHFVFGHLFGRAEMQQKSAQPAFADQLLCARQLTEIGQIAG